MANEFYVKKNGDKIILTIISKSETSIELDIEDAADLALDIQQHIDNWLYNDKAKKEAKEQNNSKNKLSALNLKWIENHFGEMYDLSPAEREVRVREIEKSMGAFYTIDPINLKPIKK